MKLFGGVSEETAPSFSDMFAMLKTSVTGNRKSTMKNVAKAMHPAFAAHSSAATNFTSGNWVTMGLAVEEYDTTNSFSSNTFTAPYNGIYHFDAAVLTVASNEYVVAGIYVNGVLTRKGGATDLQFLSTNQTGDNGCSVSCDIQLSAGDLVTARVYTDDGGDNDTSTTGNWFSGHMVCPT